MEPTRRLYLLTFIAQHGRYPCFCLPQEKAELAALVKVHAWPHMSLTPDGWAVVDRAGSVALAQKTATQEVA